MKVVAELTWGRTQPIGARRAYPGPRPARALPLPHLLEENPGLPPGARGTPGFASRTTRLYGAGVLLRALMMPISLSLKLNLS